MISARDLRFSFIDPSSVSGGAEPQRVLDGVSFDIPKDKFVVLFGPNGSGKSTILRILAGLIQPGSGTVFWPESTGGQRPPTDMVFQNYRDALLPWLTALDNVGFPLALRGVAKPQRRDQSEALLHSMGTDILPRKEYLRYPYQLSGGQQQLVAIARALNTHPQFLLLDEAFGALDHETRYRLQDIISALWESLRFYVLFVSHSIWEAVYLGDVVVLLTKKPTRVADVIPIDLPRPRTRKAEYSTAFFEARNRALKVFEKELYAPRDNR